MSKSVRKIKHGFQQPTLIVRISTGLFVEHEMRVCRFYVSVNFAFEMFIVHCT